ncbi:MAG TPA: PKD domain-containing protein [Nocardioides sp.]|nr:PKD domain-containing protein [Nocardioides sp.]
MSALNPRRLAGVAVTTVLVAGLTSGLTTLLPAEAAPSAPAPAPSGTRSTGDADGLTIENSFVSSQGWVKPGDEYPSRILLGNETGSTISGATVTITAPRGTTFLDARGPGDHPVTADQVVWTPGDIAPDARPTLVLESKAASTSEEPTIVWRDLSTRAVLDTSSARSTVFSHGPKVIPPGEAYETAKYGDRPFPVVPVQYTDRDYQPTNSGAELEGVINDPKNPGSTFNLFQEMSLGQLYPQASVGSAGLDGVGFDYEPGFDFTNAEAGQTCGGATLEDAPVDAEGTPAYPTRISNGVYNLPGDTGYYGSDANGSALVGALAGVGALQQIDSGCGSPGKLVYDAAVIADPEIDYSDFDTDKDGLVDFFMAVFAGCGGHGSSQLSAAGCEYTGAPYDNVWPHSSSLEFYYSDPVTGLPGYTTDDQLKNLEGQPLWYTDKNYDETTTTDMGDDLKVFVRVGPYNVNPETAIEKASVISHEYGHSLGLPDFYSTGSRETYGDWNLMATDKSQNMDIYSRQELGWVVPEVLKAGTAPTVQDWTDSKQDTDTITWQTPDGTPYTLTEGTDGRVQNSEAYVAKLPGRQLLDPAKFDTGDTATRTHAWWSGSGNDFGCNPTEGRNLDLAIPGLAELPKGSEVKLEFKSLWDIEWDYDYGYVLTTTNGGESYASNPSENGYTTSNTDPLAGNPNANSCQQTYDNGLTGTSGSYASGSESTDRKLGEYPESVFLADSYDISELAGEQNGAIRFSYSSDPGVARPGWFIDDLKVTATTPSGEQVLLDTDLESSGGPDDARVFNGGCREDLTTAQRCTLGWNYVAAGSPAAADHAYYMELRDRSGFDLDGKGEIDRDPIGFEPGLSLVYTDEAHGYGNAGTDDPPAQSPLDSQPEPGESAPNLNDAAYTAADRDSSYRDSGIGHTDNYEDPGNSEADARYPDVANPWRFRFSCLAFDVLSMFGDSVGPSISDGDLTADVAFRMGEGCSAFDYGYDSADTGIDAAPTARFSVRPGTPTAGQRIVLNGAGSTDDRTALDDLSYSWDLGNGGSREDATGQTVRTTYKKSGKRLVTLTVTDRAGNSATFTRSLRVRR